MKELSQRDELYNVILETVKKHGSGMRIGLVRAVLAEVEGDIGRRINNNDFDIVSGQLEERTPRE